MKIKSVTVSTVSLSIYHGFSSSHVCMWELDYKENWTPKNWCFWTVVLEKTLESPLDCKEIQPVRPNGNHSWIFIWSWSWNSNMLATWCEELTHWERPWCWERLKVGGEGRIENEMVGWHHQLNGCVWVNSGCWWWTGRPGVLQSMGSQIVGYNWMT